MFLSFLKNERFSRHDDPIFIFIKLNLISSTFYLPAHQSPLLSLREEKRSFFGLFAIDLYWQNGQRDLACLSIGCTVHQAHFNAVRFGARARLQVRSVLKTIFPDTVFLDNFHPFGHPNVQHIEQTTRFSSRTECRFVSARRGYLSQVSEQRKEDKSSPVFGTAQ